MIFNVLYVLICCCTCMYVLILPNKHQSIMPQNCPGKSCVAVVIPHNYLDLNSFKCYAQFLNSLVDLLARLSAITMPCL